jgi:hypothetical protein
MARTSREVYEQMSGTATGDSAWRSTEGPGSTEGMWQDDFTEESRSLSEHYEAIQFQAMGGQDEDFIPEKPTSYLTDVTNILFGDEMNAVGASLDADGFSWGLDTMKRAWAEHPIRSGIALGTWVLPGLGAMYKGARATRFAGMTDDMVRHSGLVDEGVEFSKLSDDVQNMVKGTMDVHTQKQLVKAKAQAAEALGKQGSMRDKLRGAFDDRFANSYMEKLDPDKPLSVTVGYIDEMNAMIRGSDVNRFLGDMPDASVGPKIARYFNGEVGALKGMSPKDRLWATRLSDELKMTQRTALDEGFITPETYKKVGSVWFPTTRVGTELGEGGPVTRTFGAAIKGKKGNVKLLAIPRTTSPHLMERAATKTDITSLIKRQEASELLEAGKNTEALSLLKGKDVEEVRGLIKAGKVDEAQGHLGAGGFMDLTPEGLTVRGLMQQKLLLENFRYLRDIALDGNFTKSAEDLAAMGPKVAKDFVSLDAVPNATIIKRMMAKKLGKDSVKEIGAVHKDIFKELTSLVTGQPAISQISVGLMELGTAMHKTAKTAFNPYTHGQNILGNITMLAWRGENMLAPSNFRSLQKSYGIVAKLQKLKRTDGVVKELPDFGKLKSLVPGGADLNIADEVMCGAVKEIIEESSLMAAEGIGAVGRILERADNSQVFVKNLAKAAQKGAAMGLPGKRGIGETLADMYMAEDAAFKLHYFLKLRQKGLSRTGAAMEVSRALPIYHTIGKTPASGRKIWFPWLSFQVEAVRILKNNMIDHPLRMGMYLHSIQALQATMYPFLDDTAEGIRETKEQLPMWAQKPMGGVTLPWKDRNNDIRTAVLDWLPEASFMPPTTAKDAPILQKLPMGLGAPAPILTGLLGAFTGRDAWGREIPTDSIGGKVRNTVVNAAGFIAPPLWQKYFMNTTAPDATWRLKQDWGEAVNPATTKPGDKMFDFFMNNFGMLAKAYASSPEQKLANEMVPKRGQSLFRGKLWRDFNAQTRSGFHQDSAATLTKIQASFVREWQGDPGMAQTKFTEALKDHAGSLLKHPQLRGMSREQLFHRLSQVGEGAGIARTKAQASLVQAIKKEIALRGFSSNGGGTSPLTGRIGGAY